MTLICYYKSTNNKLNQYLDSESEILYKVYSSGLVKELILSIPNHKINFSTKEIIDLETNEIYTFICGTPSTNYPDGHTCASIEQLHYYALMC